MFQNMRLTLGLTSPRGHEPPLTQVLLLNNTSHKFKPLENQTHAAIMTWLMKNISKGKNDSEAMLGWTCGPDSAKWPSTDLKDYEETVSLLKMLS
jgi:hypothetical protein